MECGTAEATGLGFFCLFVINPRVLSANRADLGFLFHIFLILLPPPPSHPTTKEERFPMSKSNTSLTLQELMVCYRAYLRFEKTLENIDSFRGFMEPFCLFSNRSEAQVVMSGINIIN